MNSIERTLVLLKPDAVRRGLVGELISRFERRDLRIVAMRMLRLDEDLADRHYAEHVGRDFYGPLKTFIMSGPCVAMIVEGVQAITVVRTMMGATKFLEAAPGSIRGDFALSTRENLIHGSDSADSAAREILLFFSPDQIMGPETGME